ncbi:Sporulation-specific N-acetylmuramoyl-L-alanine amidase [compost metagenome]
MHKHLVSSTGSVDRKVRIQSLKVTRETTMPAVLIEAGYLSNADDEAKLFTEQFQNNVAAGIVASIKEYLNVK